MCGRVVLPRGLLVLVARICGPNSGPKSCGWTTRRDYVTSLFGTTSWFHYLTLLLGTTNRHCYWAVLFGTTLRHHYSPTLFGNTHRGHCWAPLRGTTKYKMLAGHLIINWATAIRLPKKRADTSPRSTLLHCTAFDSTLLGNIPLHCILLYCTPPYSTLLSSTQF